MASITIKSNLSQVAGIIQDKLNKLKDRELLLRPVAFAMIDQITKRIHIEGKASDGQAIGTYSPGYLAVRTGIFKSNDAYKSGANKGKTKPTGVFTKGKNKGSSRPNYNRSSDSTVIISLTRQLENDYAAIATDKGYGIGFLNAHNYDKSQWVQETYRKKIFDLTAAETDYALAYINDLVSQVLK